jgi:hypothetical protein
MGVSGIGADSTPARTFDDKRLRHAARVPPDMCAMVRDHVIGHGLVTRQRALRIPVFGIALLLLLKLTVTESQPLIDSAIVEIRFTNAGIKSGQVSQSRLVDTPWRPGQDQRSALVRFTSRKRRCGPSQYSKLRRHQEHGKGDTHDRNRRAKRSCVISRHAIRGHRAVLAERSFPGRRSRIEREAGLVVDRISIRSNHP